MSTPQIMINTLQSTEILKVSVNSDNLHLVTGKEMAN